MTFRSVLFLSGLWIANVSFGQIAHDMMVSGHLDLVKTDHTRLLEKYQFGGEVNYFATRKITATAGLEIWTGDEFSFLIGSRWFPTEDTFVRIRGLVGANDISIGGGWSKPINENFRFEAIGDFYFKIDFAIRAGVVYIIRRNRE
jgi:hypothetical protein